MDKYLLEKMTKFYAQQIQAMLPLQLDEVTRALSVVPTKNAMGYTKELDISNPILSKVWKSSKNQYIKELYAMELQNTCGVPFSRYLIVERGMTIVYNYFDVRHQHLFRYTVEKDDCLKYERKENKT